MGIKDWLNKLWGFEPADQIDSVKPTGDGLVIEFESQFWTVSWEQIDSIAIQHFGGPGDSERIHYVLKLKDRDLRIAMLTPGMDEFVKKLQAVPGINHREYMLAIASGNEYPVVIWNNPLNNES